MPYELVIKQSKILERLLINLGAEGKGLCEKATSIKDKIGQPLLKKIEFLASIRNKLVHDGEFEITESVLIKYRQLSTEAKACLEQIIIDKANKGKTGTVEICIHCEQATVLQVFEKRKVPQKTVCVLCANTVELFSTSEKNGPLPKILKYPLFWVLHTFIAISIIFILLPRDIRKMLTQNMFSWYL